MNQETSTPVSTILLSFVAGAAVGAIVAALTTPKTGPQVREDLTALGRKAKAKADALAEEMEAYLAEAKERTNRAATDFRRGVTAAARDLRG